MSRLELVTECEHGSESPHPTIEGIKSDAIELRSGGRGVLKGITQGMSYKSDCPGGGSRIALDPDREIQPAGSGYWGGVTVQDVLDALET